MSLRDLDRAGDVLRELNDLGQHARIQMPACKQLNRIS